jgi:hypothetical protein
MMSDFQAISNTIARYFRTVDACAWERTRTLMTAPFHLDYSSFSGEPAADLDPQAILDGWAQVLPGFDHIHHQIGNLDIEIEGDTATAICHGIALHSLDRKVGSVVGEYANWLITTEQGWKLSGSRFDFKFTDGEEGLHQKAAARIAP